MVKPAAMREAIADSIAVNVKAYNVAEFCEGLGLAPQGPGEFPATSKRVYVRNRLQRHRPDELVQLARRLLEEWDDDQLQSLVEDGTGGGVNGELKNLVFAPLGVKPQIVLRDALNNAIEITKGADACLVYDRPIPADGLTWSALVGWWSSRTGMQDERSAAASLWRRLSASLDSDAEKLVFRTYTARFRHDPDAAALIPQVFLHYDPYVRRQADERPGVVVRQRMDFLMLLPQRRRVVVEVDGKHHYAIDDRADPMTYARMVAEDRRLKLAGYEVYRFGGAELMRPDSAGLLLTEFFDQLLAAERPSHL